jgi:hypothetical protein
LAECFSCENWRTSTTSSRRACNPGCATRCTPASSCGSKALRHRAVCVGVGSSVAAGALPRITAAGVGAWAPNDAMPPDLSRGRGEDTCIISPRHPAAARVRVARSGHGRPEEQPLPRSLRGDPRRTINWRIPGLVFAVPWSLMRGAPDTPCACRTPRVFPGPRA